MMALIVSSVKLEDYTYLSYKINITEEKQRKKRVTRQNL